MSGGKHNRPPTLGACPHLYPYVMDHINEVPLQAELRNKANDLERAGMMGAPDEAQFLAWLVRTMKLNKIVEIGVFRGTTALALGLALKENKSADAKLVALDINADFVKVGREAWKAAGVDSLIDFREGPAVDSLDKLIAEGGTGTFDLAFIDADKSNYVNYYERCLQLLRPGGIIAVDNVLWGGDVLLPAGEQDADTRTICAINELIRNDKRVTSTLLPIADGCYLCTKL